ncbi:MAG: N-acetyltransferase [Methanothrix sp.]|jgi:Predicted acetyltransferase|uniref:Acetyltransferase n=1 Tax=Methanothrix harundinacea TaxID=301375 RepID=A0A101FTM3_9EURY|nr:MAG: Acetyltransferase [Methanothrix harundinacea]MDD2638372.1 N-acetyltransferase [Methanothrix sp.]MDI9397984.1 N-acetyltransferase [Euryarchaeota archaeon]KUK97321.1 MAG: Acetyltransferase [Methanothrix harundinacea]MCP1392754.1 N-acetyltransferase [Methanothrix harundinacea]
MIIIREERPEDIEAIRRINEEAFGQPAEAEIVDQLREACENLLSLVAVQGEEVVGHILFSTATIGEEGETYKVEGMGLAPMAVLPRCQGQGIGSLLIHNGIKMLRERGCPFIIVLGYPEYYPRFGFERASRYGIHSEWSEVPDEAFMILILNKTAMVGATGIARYRREFDEAV